jgi:hypothetical protein
MVTRVNAETEQEKGTTEVVPLRSAVIRVNLWLEPSP